MHDSLANVSQKARARVEEEKTDETINPEINPDILRIHADMSRVIGAAEAAGEEGNIDTVQVKNLVPYCRRFCWIILMCGIVDLLFTCMQELIYIKLEELQKEKNAVLVRDNVPVSFCLSSCTCLRI